MNLHYYNSLDYSRNGGVLPVQNPMIHSVVQALSYPISLLVSETGPTKVCCYINYDILLYMSNSIIQ